MTTGGKTPNEQRTRDTPASASAVQPPCERKPANTSLKQQRMAAWRPILHPVYVIWTLFIIAAVFIPSGWKLREVSESVVEYAIQYDAYEGLEFTDCEIDAPNEGKNCIFSFEVKKNMTGPILIYYEIDNFHQNHLDYAVSRDDKQVSRLLNHGKTTGSLFPCGSLRIFD